MVLGVLRPHKTMKLSLSGFLYGALLGQAGLIVAQASSEGVDPPTNVIADPSSFVLPFIGTTNGGHVFPGKFIILLGICYAEELQGATLPHGMVKVGMDTDSPGNHAGYDADPQYNVTGFSQLHDDGTGGAVPLSNFKVWAFPTCSTFEKCPTSINSRKIHRKLLPDGSADDAASPGYFSTNLTNSIRVELTATRRTALHRYTFPPGTTQPRIMLDLTNDGQHSSTNPVMTLDPSTGKLEGGAEFSASFGPGRYSAFTCVTFKGDGYDLGEPTEYGIWLGNFPVRGTTDLLQVYYGYDNEFAGFVSEMGGLLTFKPAPDGGKTSILVRVGVSFISSAQACANAEEEIPDFDFDGVHTTARAQWNDILRRVQVDTSGVDLETVKLLYSSLYRTHLAPADYTGENPKWTSTEPYFDSFYCNWDTYRTLYPLMSLHDPATFSRIVRAMIDIQKHEGWLPECRGATAMHFIQGGSSTFFNCLSACVPVKVLRQMGIQSLGNFSSSKYPRIFEESVPKFNNVPLRFQEQAAALEVDEDDLYNALLADAEIQPANWNLQGRQVDAWKQFNYLPQDMFSPGGANTKQCSRTLEHSFNDFSISQVAKALGKTDDAKKYAERAGNFVNLWNPNITVPGGPGVVGMIQFTSAFLNSEMRPHSSFLGLVSLCTFATALYTPQAREYNDGIHLAVDVRCGPLFGNTSDVNAGIDPHGIKTIVSFGDSFTDGGHEDGGPLDPPIIIPPSVLAGGRSTNGYTWVEHVANDTHSLLKDYAQSGACIDLSLWPSNPTKVDFIGQVKTFLSQNNTLDPRTTVYSVFFGIKSVSLIIMHKRKANHMRTTSDYIASMSTNLFVSLQTHSLTNTISFRSADGDHMQAAAQALLGQIQLLASPPTNARNFMVLDVYGRGVHTPSGEAFKQTIYTGLSNFHAGNNGTRLNVSYINFSTIWDGVLGSDPGYAAFGYTTTDSCVDCSGCSSTQWCDDPDHYFYWISG
ncbi:hypothetical protein H0H93_010583, partial [Arthromyces matolae]